MQYELNDPSPLYSANSSVPQNLNWYVKSLPGSKEWAQRLSSMLATNAHSHGLLPSIQATWYAGIGPGLVVPALMVASTCVAEVARTASPVSASVNFIMVFSVLREH